MRSNLFASTLAIALGLAGLLISLTTSDTAAAGARLYIPKDLSIESKQKLEDKLHDLKKLLILYRKQNLEDLEVETIGEISDTYFKLENPEEAEKIIKEAINQFKVSKDIVREQKIIKILTYYLRKNWYFSAGLGLVADSRISRKFEDGELSWNKVMDFSRFSLFVSKLVGDHDQVMKSLHGIGWTYRNLGRFYDAINYYNQAFKIASLKKDMHYIAFLHVEIGLIYSDIGMYSKSVDEIQLSLSISSELSLKFHKLGLKSQTLLTDCLGHPPSSFASSRMTNSINEKIYLIEVFQRCVSPDQLKKFAITHLGLAYINLEEYDKALPYLEEASKETSAIYLHNAFLGLGILYSQKGEYNRSLEIYHKALSVLGVGDPSAKAEIFQQIGLLYLKKGDYSNALENFQQALIYVRKLENSTGESTALSNIAVVVEKQNQSELAIAFYKESVNITESIRQNLRRMTIAEQRAYTESISKTYRSLANLLLSQGRVLEAQQVLELLKNQELRDYTKDTRSSSPSNGSPLNPLEAPIPAAFNDKISLGNQLTECDRQRCTDRSKLNSQVTAANKTFIALVTKLKDGLRSQEIKDPAQLQTDKLTIAAQKVILANPNAKTVLVYPLVLEDKLWLVWGSQAGKSGVIFDSKEVPVTRKDLSEKVRQLQEKLSNPNSNPKELQQVSQQLYQWLIKPIRQQLDDNKVQQIVFSLDRATRYIPMGTLHDGKQYLIENFALSTILTADIDTTDRLAPNPQDSPILGLGLTQAIAGLNALPAVETEINAIVRTDPTSKDGIYPGIKLFNQDFTEQSLRDNISGRRILHIATHGSFVPGNPEDSFLVLGNGQKLSITAIKSITDLANTHLVVLSACETGKGGVDKEGIEVAGLGHYFLLSGAKSVLASLWLVNDPATSLLMNRFYQTLSKGNLSKAEALRQVQIAFINGQLTDADAKALDRGVRLHRPGQLPPGSFAHPYYWAPFILIGNSL